MSPLSIQDLRSFDLCKFLFDASKERNGQTFEANLGGRRVLVIQTLEEADWVLRGNVSNYRKELWPFRQVMGSSRLTEDGDAWRSLAQVTQPYLAKSNPRDIWSATLRHSAGLCSQLLHPAHAGRLNQFAIDVTTIRILSDTLLDGRLTASAESFCANMHILLDHASSYAFGQYPDDAAAAKAAIRSLAKSRYRIVDLFSDIRRRLPPGGCLLSALDKADRSNDNDLIFNHELMMFMAAGSDTSAAAIGWCCQALADHPDVQEKLRYEIQGKDKNQPLDFLALSKAPLLNAFVEEVLRLFPPVPMLGRLSVGTDQIGLFDVRKGDLVFVSLVGIHRDGQQWGDPDRFSLDRHGIDTPRTARAIPFSMGPRVCGGAKFAMVEIKAVIVALLTKLHFEGSNKQAGPFEWRISMRRQGGHSVNVKEL